MQNSLQSAPIMLQNRINILRVLEAFADESAEDIMSRMMTFEADLSGIIRNIVEELASKKDNAALIDHFNSATKILITMGADDLLESNQKVLETLKSGSKPASSAVVLEWLNIAAETRATNIALFQACQLFGHALNGKPLEIDEEDEDDDGSFYK